MTDIQSQKRLDALSAYVVFTGQNGENVGILLTRKEDAALYQFFSCESLSVEGVEKYMTATSQLVEKNDVKSLHRDGSFRLHSAIKLNTPQPLSVEHVTAISRRMMTKTYADWEQYDSLAKWLAKYLGIVENSDRKLEKLAEMVVAHRNAAKPKSVVSIASVMQATPMAKEVWWNLQ